jgi:hypothetical protein
MPEPKKLVIHNPQMIAEQAAAAAAAAEAKKNEPYERLWDKPTAVNAKATATEPPPQAAGTAKTNRSYTPPPMLQDMDSGTAWWKPPEPKGLISNNIRGY